MVASLSLASRTSPGSLGDCRSGRLHAGANLHPRVFDPFWIYLNSHDPIQPGSALRRAGLCQYLRPEAVEPLHTTHQI